MFPAVETWGSLPQPGSLPQGRPTRECCRPGVFKSSAGSAGRWTGCSSPSCPVSPAIGVFRSFSGRTRFSGQELIPPRRRTPAWRRELILPAPVGREEAFGRAAFPSEAEASVGNARGAPAGTQTQPGRSHPGQRQQRRGGGIPKQHDIPDLLIIRLNQRSG